MNKKSQESGVSKQQIIRVMIEKCLSDEYGENIILNARKIKQQIKNEYENTKISGGMDPLQD